MTAATEPPVADIATPPPEPERAFTSGAEAVAELARRYEGATGFLRAAFARALAEGRPPGRVRAFYPEIATQIARFVKIDSRLSFGYVAEPGSYATTVTRPDLFADYLAAQIDLVIRNHGVPVQVRTSATPIAAVVSVVNRSRPAAAFRSTISSSPGS